MWAEERSVCSMWVVKGAPKRICRAVTAGTVVAVRIRANMVVYQAEILVIVHIQFT